MRKYLRAHIIALAAVGVVLAACVVVSTTNRAVPVSESGGHWNVRSPVRAHLRSGELVVFKGGATIQSGEIRGDGIRYDVLRQKSSAPTASVSLTDVLGLEAVERQVNPGRTFFYSVPTLAASGIGVLALGIILFGSCPTIYVDSAGSAALQAESFSFSIAPLFAKRDVDRLNVRADSAGNVRVEVRNEAHETHYIDQLELLEARHRADEVLLPVREGLIAVSDIASVGVVRDSRGRDVSRVLAFEDEIAFASDERLLAAGADGSAPPDDYLDIVVPRPQGRNSVALVLKMRSSLLSTTIFYDHMLARPGARSLDWLGHDLARIGSAAKVGKWYSDNFGLRVLVKDGEHWRADARLINFGPAAWRNVGVVVRDLGRGDSVRLRLAFTTDEWRIDRVALAWQIRPVVPRAVPIARVTTAQGDSRPTERGYLANADERYLETMPGSRFFADFHVGPDGADARTFLVAAEGYYTEWVRPEWILASRDSMPFSTRTTKREVLQSWHASKDSLEQDFFIKRVPVP